VLARSVETCWPSSEPRVRDANGEVCRSFVSVPAPMSTTRVVIRSVVRLPMSAVFTTHLSSIGPSELAAAWNSVSGSSRNAAASVVLALNLMSYWPDEPAPLATVLESTTKYVPGRSALAPLRVIVPSGFVVTHTLPASV
jgi:hypothetical protein